MGVSYLGHDRRTAADPQRAPGGAGGGAFTFNHPNSFVDVGSPGGLLNERFVCAWGELDEPSTATRVPPSFGAILHWVGQGVKPVDGPNGQGPAKTGMGLQMHRENARVATLDGETTFRNAHRSHTPGWRPTTR